MAGGILGGGNLDGWVFGCACGLFCWCLAVNMSPGFIDLLASSIEWLFIQVLKLIIESNILINMLLYL
jgi:hypothetical protein